ncbi:TlpA disulfide reductase family protein [Bernardetia sp. Wsw4-3y2]|uniref:TlpA disulfide reductase family protein n=1 Tax=Bernardetia sp. Wsw4-3y2 TaxID=3127471 RepID=UPI0030D1FECD
MKLINLILFLSLSILSFRTIEDKENDTVLPQIIHENEEVTVYAIKDSIRIGSDSLFFHIDVFRQDMTYTKGYVPIIDGKAKFTVPKNTAFFIGYFYSMDDRDPVAYIRRVHNKEGKIAKNAYQNAYESRMNKEALQKELTNYPTNLMAYASYISYLAEGYSLGRVSDTLFKTEVKESLKKVEKKLNSNEASDLAALSILYGYNQQFDKSKEILYKLLSSHPNSNFLNKAFSSYNYSYGLHNDDSNDVLFMESFRQTVGKYHPRSPLGRGDMHGEYSNNKWIIKGYYKDEDIIANNNYNFKYMDSTLEYSIIANIEAYLNQKDYASSKKWATFLLQEAKKGKWLHDAPLYKKERKYLFGKNINYSIANGYYWLGHVEIEEGDFESALSYIDSSLYFANKNTDKYSVNFRRFQLERKAFLQRKTNQTDSALKTYETLYQETKDDKVLDSIQVIFQEMEQEEDFESYTRNLKRRVENEAMKDRSDEIKKIAANFSTKDMNDNEIRLSEMKGRVVVINFWANYCLPCIKEIPLFNEFWRETQTKGIVFLAATTNTPIEVTRFAQQQKEMFGFSVLPNAKELSKSYDIGSLPTTIIINKKGEIVHRETGFGGNIDKLKQVVLEELAK